MTDIAHVDRRELPTRQSLLKATGAALAIASLVLITSVLPAEYGVDPTGIGARLGLTRLNATPETAPPVQLAPPPPMISETVTSEPLSPVSIFDALWRSPSPYRTDEMSITLAPNEGAEIKARMREGERFVFNWRSEGGAVNFDMHGEELNAPSNEFTSFRKGVGAIADHGAFSAPFDGTHGWYWRNRGKESVKVSVQTSGFYEKLYRPK